MPLILALGSRYSVSSRTGYIVSNETNGKTSLYVVVKHLAVCVVQRIDQQAAGKEEVRSGSR